MTLPTLQALARSLEAREVSGTSLVEDSIARIEDPAGEGSRVYRAFDAELPRRAAGAQDQLRASRAEGSRYAGIPVSIKDLFDVKGQVTASGSLVLADADAALEDAPPVAALRRAGFVMMGRTNMSEFAFSGLGLNPHLGTPLNSFDRATGRIPGGSTSGGAVSVSDGMAHAALGSDTGGSCRIPAALSGLVGFKPTARRISTRGALPLSTTLDSVGTLARSVHCCASLDAVLTGMSDDELPEVSLQGLRFIAPDNVVLDGMDASTSEAYGKALALLSSQGVRIVTAPMPSISGIAGMNVKGGFPAAEAYAWHRALLENKRDQYDPRVAKRIMRGAEQSAADYIDLLACRAALMAQFNAQASAFDAILMPTVPIVAPAVAQLADDEAFTSVNLLVLRNPTVFNVMDGCAISVPVHEPGSAPVGLTLGHVALSDRRLLAIAAAVERAVSASR